jgi:hypothetical protein
MRWIKSITSVRAAESVRRRAFRSAKPERVVSRGGKRQPHGSGHHFTYVRSKRSTEQAGVIIQQNIASWRDRTERRSSSTQKVPHPRKRYRESFLETVCLKQFLGQQ